MTVFLFTVGGLAAIFLEGFEHPSFRRPAAFVFFLWPLTLAESAGQALMSAGAKFAKWKRGW